MLPCDVRGLGDADPQHGAGSDGEREQAAGDGQRRGGDMAGEGARVSPPRVPGAGVAGALGAAPASGATPAAPSGATPDPPGGPPPPRGSAPNPRGAGAIAIQSSRQGLLRWGHLLRGRRALCRCSGCGVDAIATRAEEQKHEEHGDGRRSHATIGAAERSWVCPWMPRAKHRRATRDPAGNRLGTP